MTLRNLREMGVKRLIANCLTNACSPNAPFARLEMLTAEPPQMAERNSHNGGLSATSNC
jgi:hypothetical protein